MKKIIFLLLVSASIISCSNDNNVQSTDVDSQSGIDYSHLEKYSEYTLDGKVLNDPGVIDNLLKEAQTVLYGLDGENKVTMFSSQDKFDTYLKSDNLSFYNRLENEKSKPPSAPNNIGYKLSPEPTDHVSRNNSSAEADILGTAFSNDVAQMEDVSNWVYLQFRRTTGSDNSSYIMHHKLFNGNTRNFYDADYAFGSGTVGYDHRWTTHAAFHYARTDPGRYKVAIVNDNTAYNNAGGAIIVLYSQENQNQNQNGDVRVYRINRDDFRAFTDTPFTPLSMYLDNTYDW